VAERLQGRGVSPGIASGVAYLLHAESLPVVPAPVPPERVEQELEAFDRARDEARAQLQSVREQVREVLGDHYAGIIEAQLAIVDDPSLLERTTRRIRVGRVSARWALKEAVGEFTRRFEAMDDPYLRERVGDLSDVHHRLQRLLRGDAARREVPAGPLLVVAHSVVPSDAVALAGKGVVGLATEAGGPTSHTAILAQALSVPAVVGLHGITAKVRSGDALIIDGESGEVQLLPSRAESDLAERRRLAWIERERESAASARALPSITRDGVEVAVRANIEFPGELTTALDHGARGVGLYRSEFVFLSHSPELPGEDDHFGTYVEIAERVAPEPAVVRTLDLGGEKYFHEVVDGAGSNPVLGLRGVRLCLERPDIFRPQLRGLLRAAALQENLRVMLPMVSSVDEVREVRRLLALEADDLRSAGVGAREELPLGIMIEVPAAALAADLLCRDADFLSVGTNDLIQYALAADRGDDAVDYLYQPLHPGVLRMIRHSVEGARARGVPISICGEMAADPAALAVLIGLGLHELSVQPRAIPRVRAAIRDVDSREARERAEQALERPVPAPPRESRAR
jgi:phosphotransferase system enzyme I (PtsI)